MKSTLALRGAMEHQIAFASRAFVLSALGACLVGCETPDTFLPYAQFGGPAGVLEGTVNYSGPLPCTEKGRIVGAAVLLGFDIRLLPPPEGLGTSAASVAVVPGETLFAGIRDQLYFDPTGARYCPPQRTPFGASFFPAANATANWAMAPLAGGIYQVRGFYDLDGYFDPAFLVANLPTRGDVGGGAISNAPAALLGFAPKYETFTLGTPGLDGWPIIGDEGAHVSGISVTLGQQLPLERPVFYPAEVLDAFEGNTDPQHVVMRSDMQLNELSAANPSGTEQSFIRIRLAAGVLPDEVDAASKNPFFLPVQSNGTTSPSFLFTQQDANHNGIISKSDGDHVPESDLIPSLYPLAVFNKLKPGSKLVAQTRPTVIMQGITLIKTLIGTALKPEPIKTLDTELTVAVRPTAICLDPLKPTEPGIAVIPHDTDAKGNPLLSNPDALKQALAAQFGRPMELVVGCLPEGDYSINLVYPTGQAWTLPNEGEVCAANEPMSGDGKKCGTRARLASQGAVFTIGPPNDAAYCALNRELIKQKCVDIPSE